MSYCRMGKDSDVYVYRSAFSCGDFGFEYYVHTRDKPNYSFKDPRSVLTYLEKIKGLGFKVPKNAINRIKREINES